MKHPPGSYAYDAWAHVPYVVLFTILFSVFVIRSNKKRMRVYCVGAVVLFVKYMYVGVVFVHCSNDFQCIECNIKWKFNHHLQSVNPN